MSFFLNYKVDMTQSGWKPDLYVISRFLEILWERKKSYKKTQLQMAVKLNYNVYMKYFDWLLEKELIIISDEGGNQFIRITSKGVEVYDTIVLWIKETIGD